MKSKKYKNIIGIKADVSIEKDVDNLIDKI